MGLPARGGPGLGLSGAAQTNRCCWSSHEKQTAIKPRASRDREFLSNEQQWRIECNRRRFPGASQPSSCQDSDGPKFYRDNVAVVHANWGRSLCSLQVALARAGAAWPRFRFGLGLTGSRPGVHWHAVSRRPMFTSTPSPGARCRGSGVQVWPALQLRKYWNNSVPLPVIKFQG